MAGAFPFSQHPRPFGYCLACLHRGQVLADKRILHQPKERLPLRASHDRAFMGFRQRDRIPLAFTRLVKAEAMHTLRQFGIFGHPLRDFDSRDLRPGVKIKERDSLLIGYKSRLRARLPKTCERSPGFGSSCRNNWASVKWASLAHSPVGSCVQPGSQSVKRSAPTTSRWPGRLT